MKALNHYWGEATKHHFVDDQLFPPLIQADGSKVSFIKIGKPVNALRLGENPDGSDSARLQTDVIADSVSIHSILLRYNKNLHQLGIKQPKFGSSVVFSHGTKSDDLVLDLQASLASMYIPASIQIHLTGSINLQTGNLIVNAEVPVLVPEQGKALESLDVEILGYMLTAHTFNPNTSAPPAEPKRKVHLRTIG